jgi:uncharacterized protein YuzE
MKISYDTKYDVLYIKFREGESQVATRNLADDIAIDLDEAGRVVGLEILAASEHVDLDELLPIAVTKT